MPAGAPGGAGGAQAAEGITAGRGDGASGAAGAEGGPNGAGSGGPGGAQQGGPGGGGTGKPEAPVKPQPKPEPAADTKALLAGYMQQVKAAVLRHKRYPGEAERLGHEGAVKVSFTLDAAGSLLKASVSSSSGYGELDDAALDAVRTAAPFEPIPRGAGRDELRFALTLNFNLR